MNFFVYLSVHTFIMYHILRSCGQGVVVTAFFSRMRNYDPVSVCLKRVVSEFGIYSRGSDPDPFFHSRIRSGSATVLPTLANRFNKAASDLNWSALSDSDQFFFRGLDLDPQLYRLEPW